MYVTNTIKENKAVKLRVDVQWKAAERGWGEEEEEERKGRRRSEVILFQLKRFKKINPNLC